MELLLPLWSDLQKIHETLRGEQIKLLVLLSRNILLSKPENEDRFKFHTWQQFNASESQIKMNYSLCIVLVKKIKDKNKNVMRI